MLLSLVWKLYIYILYISFTWTCFVSKSFWKTISLHFKEQFLFDCANRLYPKCVWKWNIVPPYFSDLFNNPIAQETDYRFFVIHAVPSVELLDRQGLNILQTKYQCLNLQSNFFLCNIVKIRQIQQTSEMSTNLVKISFISKLCCIVNSRNDIQLKYEMNKNTNLNDLHNIVSKLFELCYVNYEACLLDIVFCLSCSFMLAFCSRYKKYIYCWYLTYTMYNVYEILKLPIYFASNCTFLQRYWRQRRSVPGKSMTRIKRR